MEKRFEETKNKLESYKETFFKVRGRLQQDHDSFVKIKAKESRELDEQMAIQKELEVQTEEALQQKADLHLNITTEESMGAAEKLLANSTDPVSRRTGQLVTAQQEVTNAILLESEHEKKIRDQTEELEALQRKEHADKLEQEKKLVIEK